MTDIIHYNPYGTRTQQSVIPRASGYGIIELISNVENPVGLEIGTDVGETASFLLSNRTDLLLHCIDPYTNYIDWNGNNLDDRTSIYSQMKTNLKPYEDRYVIHKTTSDSAANTFEDGSFDFIFIDGLHEYDQVLKDCQNYYSKVKKNGLFCGHDFKTIRGVNRAVIEFADSIQKEVLTTHNDVWYFYK